MTLSDNTQDQFMNALTAFIQEYRRKRGQCPDCGQSGRRNGKNYKGKQQFECVNRRCKRTSFNEE